MDPLRENAKKRLNVLSRDIYNESEKHFQNLTGDIRNFIDSLLLEGEQEGLEKVGDGLGRLVFRLPNNFLKPAIEEDFVVKIAIFNPEKGKDGLVQNGRECKIWTENPSARIDLVPVILTDDSFYWLIMRFAKPIDRTQRELVSEISLKGPDVRPENLGWFQGEIRLFDYGWGVNV